MHYYKLNQKVLANCGTRREPEWIPGEVIDLNDMQVRPYRVQLERESDGKREWYFPGTFLKADNPRNRRLECLSDA